MNSAYSFNFGIVGLLSCKFIANISMAGSQLLIDEVCKLDLEESRDCATDIGLI